MSDIFRHKISKMVSHTGHRINSWEMNIEDIKKILHRCKMLESLVEEAYTDAHQYTDDDDDIIEWRWERSESKRKLEEIRKIK